MFGVKIQNDGKTYLSVENTMTQVKTNYFLHLASNDIDTISSLIRNILVNKFDSIYEFGCDQCLTYSLIIKTKDHKFKVSFHGYLFADCITKPIDQFAFYVNKMVKKYQTNVDSTFIYESKQYLILPPPLPHPTIVPIGKK
jgi:hypothetical protein